MSGYSRGVAALGFVALIGSGSLHAQDGPSLKIILPADGVEVTAGQTVEVRVDITHPELVSNVNIVGTGPLGVSPAQPAAPSLKFNLTLPAKLISATYSLTAVGRLNVGGPAMSVPIHIHVPPETLATLLVLDKMIFDYPGQWLPINVSGKGANDISPIGAKFLSFSSADKSVATVNDHGIVRAQAPGRTEIAIQYTHGGSNLSTMVHVTVQGGITGDLDGDGRVTSSDRNELHSWLGHTAEGPTDARDLNHDGSIDNKDLVLLASLCDSSCPALDSAPPVVTCGSPDGVWHDNNVTLACTAEDAGVGLVNAADAGFSLGTNVAAGTETSSASTGSRQVCDKANNCATAGPISGNMIDRKSAAVSLTSPAANAVFTLGQSVAASYACSDGGSGVASCTGGVASGAAISTSPVGSYNFVVNATDNVGNSSSATAKYVVGYGVCALYDSTRAVTAGTIIPIKLQLCDSAKRNVSASGIALSAIEIAATSGAIIRPVPDSGKANLDSAFRYDAALAGYIFNLNTKGLAPGTYRLNFRVASDPVSHEAVFKVR